LPAGYILTPEMEKLLAVVSEGYVADDQALAEARAETDRRTTQLISSTSQAYSFLDSIHKGFVMCDTSGEVVLANQSLRSMLPLPNDGQSLTIEGLDKLLSPSLELKNLITECMRTKQPLERDNVSVGSRLLHCYIAPLANQSTATKDLLGVVILLEDVTEQRMLDRSKDEFLSIASHELRTPLTAIRGNTALIRKYYAKDIPNPDMNQMIDDIHDSSVRLIGIVNDFLDVAAMEQGKISMHPQNFEPQSVITEAVRELEELCKSKGITLAADESIARVPAVHADLERTKQVFINLIGNATKFTDKGSITISARADDHVVYFSVTDTGSGMSPENQKLLFHKFQQAGSSLLTRDTAKGTGLGLYISKLIVELSGGTIGLEKSELGVGSTFTFSLPKA
jgi:signal transduction histidine kinase